MHKRKNNKSKSLIRAEQEMAAFLKRVGYKGGLQGKAIHEIPDYATDQKYKTSDTIPANISAKKKKSILYLSVFF